MPSRYHPLETEVHDGIAASLCSGFVLAPMAGYTDSAFRRICRRFGAACTVTEMIAAAGLSRGSRKTEQLLRHSEEERPIGVQLFGSRSADFARAAELVTGRGFAFIDINAGCPVRKVVTSGSGSALLRDTPRLLRIVRETAANTDLPVTVKTRLGWSPDEPVPPGLPAELAEAGASAVTIHARYRSDLFSGNPRTGELARLVESSPIPVVASGQSGSPREALEFLSRSGASALMVGRGALGSPWIFRALTGSGPGVPLPGELHSTLMDQLDMMTEYIPQKHLYHVMRGHLVLYFRGFRGAPDLRRRAVTTVCREEIEELAREADRLAAREGDRDG
jgi:nifR3 family TIM-barrel protein